MVFQYLQTRTGNAAVFEDHALLFCLRKKGNVRADGVILSSASNISAAKTLMPARFQLLVDVPGGGFSTTFITRFPSR